MVDWELVIKKAKEASKIQDVYMNADPMAPGADRFERIQSDAEYDLIFEICQELLKDR
jgi:hypothetical protein